MSPWKNVGLFAGLFALLAWQTHALAAEFHSKTSGHGLTLQTDCWMQGDAAGGYHPVHIELSNAGPPRRLRVVIERPPYQTTTETSRVVDLDRNSRVRFTLSVPLTERYFSGEVKVYERGMELKKLTQSGLSFGNYRGGSEPNRLIVSSSAPDVSRFDTATMQRGAPSQAAQLRARQVWLKVGSETGTVVLPPEELPTKWIDYTTLDLVTVSLDELEQVSTSSRDALIAGTLAGGNLLIYGVGQDGENLETLNRLLDLRDRPPRGASWRLPDLADRPSSGQSNRRAKAVAPHFRLRDFGLGQLVMLRSPDPFPGTFQDWAWVFNTLGDDRLDWTSRHGINPSGSSDVFWNFLIPGVGRAPVGSFQVLITLFVVLIGPVNYLVLRRRNRLYLMIVTVPAVALATVALILGSGMFADGFTAHTRVRSMMLLDQTRAEAVSWSRISYYAGLAPFGGLRFSPDTAVYPIKSDERRVESWQLDWSEDQHLASGWLRSRTPTQFLTVAYHHADGQLIVSGNSDGSLRVTNRLGAPVQMLALADKDGRMFLARDLDTGASAVLESISHQAAHSSVQASVQEQRLQLPPEMRYRTARRQFVRPRIAWAFNPSAPQGLMERMLGKLQGGSTEDWSQFIRAGSYVAVVDRLPEIELGIAREQVQEAGSLYVIWGMY